MRAALLVLVVLAAACSAAESAPTATTIPAPTSTTTTTTITADSTVEFVGGDRPARLVLPPAWSATGESRPLVVLLHGYSASGELQDVYLGVSATGADLGYLTLTPDGTKDPLGNQFWNVSNLPGTVDDAAYLVGIIDEVVADYNADPGRVYLVGHSNGGFMANKLACEMPERIAGLAAIAGGLVVTDSECREATPVLFVQGTDDGTVPYEGGSLLGVTVLGADDTVAEWRRLGGCGPAGSERGPFDFDLLTPGDETTITAWDDCEVGVSVELWRMEGSGHVPGFRPEFRAALMTQLLGQEGP